MVAIPLLLDKSNFCDPLIITKHLATTMIIGTGFPNHHVRAINCRKDVVEITHGNVRILSRNSTIVDSAKADVDKARPPGDKNRTLKRRLCPGVTFQLHRRFALLRDPSPIVGSSSNTPSRAHGAEEFSFCELPPAIHERNPLNLARQAFHRDASSLPTSPPYLGESRNT